MIRTREEWHAHPQGKAVAELPLFEIMRIGDAPPEPPGKGKRPLSGDVPSISAPHVPHMDGHVMDNGGRLNCWKRVADRYLRVTYKEDREGQARED